MLKCVSKERNFFLEMSASFDLNHDRLAGDSKFATIASSLSTQSRIDSREAFNRYCRKACLLWSEHFSHSSVGTSAFFTELLDRIDRRGEGTIKTPWGGVVIVLHEHPRVEKYLVEAVAPGDRFYFEPGMEHCLIGTENLLVFERSTDPKGMDQDLVFIYEPDSDIS